MSATRGRSLPSGPEWSYEVKWDGYRAQAVKRAEAVLLVSRNGKDLTKQFPSIAAEAVRLRASEAVLDGEIVAIDGEGRPSFQALHHWDTEGVALVYYAFDLLYLNGRDLIKEPLERRRALLKDLVGGTGVFLSEPLPGTASQIASAVRAMNLEGVVAKRRDSRYEPGRRSEAWVKVRFSKRQEFVVGGFKPVRDAFDSILVGYYDRRRLMCAGKVRNGITPHFRAELAGRFARLLTPRCPFVNLPTSRSSHWGEGITNDEMTRLRWIKPSIVVEISFAEWTRDGSLRHASFEGIREDKPPRDVVRET
jgi:bifunctional non-homologous end joining protein LigD